jgi:hypothetical protein
VRSTWFGMQEVCYWELDPRPSPQCGFLTATLKSFFTGVYLTMETNDRMVHECGAVRGTSSGRVNLRPLRKPTPTSPWLPKTPGIEPGTERWEAETKARTISHFRTPTLRELALFLISDATMMNQGILHSWALRQSTSQILESKRITKNAFI